MTRDEYLKLDVVEQLRLWASIKDSQMPAEVIPAEVLEPGKWGETLRQLHLYAIAEIERLRKQVEWPEQDIDKIPDPQAREEFQKYLNHPKIEPTDDFAAIKRKIRNST